jgi:ABC-type uncharacterized transport system substrate-binding protein
MKALLAALSAAAAIVIAASHSYGRDVKGVPHVGYLSVLSANDHGPHTEAFRKALRDLGYVERSNLVVEYRWADFKLDRLPSLARELVGMNVSAIVALEPPAVLAAAAATKSIPIVMRATTDPVKLGLIDSLAHPGRNVTGVMSVSTDLQGKRLELLRDVMGRGRNVAVLWNPDLGVRASQLDNFRRAGEALGLRMAFVEVRSAAMIDAAFRADAIKSAAGLTAIRDPLVVSHRAAIAKHAVAAHLPSIFDERDYAISGGLMSFGADLTDLYRRAALYLDKILKGAKPGDLPVEQPTKFELVVNLKTAKALGIAIPQSILLRADEVIE